MFRDFLRGDNELLVIKINKQFKERVDNGRKCFAPLRSKLNLELMEGQSHMILVQKRTNSGLTYYFIISCLLTVSKHL